jgi:hypothetical protein
LGKIREGGVYLIHPILLLLLLLLLMMTMMKVMTIMVSLQASLERGRRCLEKAVAMDPLDGAAGSALSAALLQGQGTGGRPERDKANRLWEAATRANSRKSHGIEDGGGDLGDTRSQRCMGNRGSRQDHYQYVLHIPWRLGVRAMPCHQGSLSIIRSR